MKNFWKNYLLFHHFPVFFLPLKKQIIISFSQIYVFKLTNNLKESRSMKIHFNSLSILKRSVFSSEFGIFNNMNLSPRKINQVKRQLRMTFGGQVLSSTQAVFSYKNSPNVRLFLFLVFKDSFVFDIISVNELTVSYTR